MENQQGGLLKKKNDSDDDTYLTWEDFDCEGRYVLKTTYMEKVFNYHHIAEKKMSMYEF